jgi:hypothetical protein
MTTIMAIDNQTRRSTFGNTATTDYKKKPAPQTIQDKLIWQMTDARDTATRLDAMLRGGASASCLVTDGS